MKNLTFIFVWFLSFQLMGQEVFEFSEQGLSPKFKELQLENKSDSLLVANAIQWIENNKEAFNLKRIKSVSNKQIEFSSVKNNGTSLDKQYFHVKYGIELVFEDGKIKFTPKSIQLKLNSKYDMGWKDFDINDGYSFYKRGKVIRKYRKYLSDITDHLNSLFTTYQSQKSK